MEYTSPQIRMIAEADRHRREAERQGASGSKEDQARVLMDRIRCGELTRERVEAAAALGDPISMQLEVEEIKFVSPAKIFDWESKILGAMEHARLTSNEIINFLADCAEQVLPIFTKVYPDDSRLTDAIVAARSENPDTGTIRSDAYHAFTRDDRLQPVPDDINNPTLRRNVRFAAQSVYWALETAVALGSLTTKWPRNTINCVTEAGLDKSWVTNRLIDYLMERI